MVTKVHSGDIQRSFRDTTDIEYCTEQGGFAVGMILPEVLLAYRVRGPGLVGCDGLVIFSPELPGLEVEHPQDAVTAQDGERVTGRGHRDRVGYCMCLHQCYIVVKYQR